MGINYAFGRERWFQGPVIEAREAAGLLGLGGFGPEIVMEDVLVMWSKAREGVHGRAPVMILRAIACTRSILVPLVSLRVAMITLQDRMGRITAVYINLHVLG